MVVARLLIIVVSLASGCLAFDADTALIGALRWHHRWIAALPATTKAIDCTVAAFSNSSFAYCQPGYLAIDLDAPQGSAVAVTNVIQEPAGFSGALLDFMQHRYSGPPQNPTVRKLSVSTIILAQCKVDEQLTRRMVDGAVGSRQREVLFKQGITLRYPVACEGDPFYLVYFMRGKAIEWIWQVKPGAGPVWHYDNNGTQRRIPEVAISNLAKPELWYTPSPR